MKYNTIQFIKLSQSIPDPTQPKPNQTIERNPFFPTQPIHTYEANYQIIRFKHVDSDEMISKTYVDI